MPKKLLEELEDLSPYKEIIHPYDEISKLRELVLYIEKNKPEKGSCIEIGFGNGYLLKALQMRGWEVFGLELSEKAIRNAKSLGIHAIKGDVEDTDLIDRHFDVVILCHVLEHIYSPRIFLHKIKGFIKKGGCLFIQVPDFGKLPSYIKDKREKSILCAAHLNYFTLSSLNELLKRSGWSPRTYSLDEENYFITLVAEPK